MKFYDSVCQLVELHMSSSESKRRQYTYNVRGVGSHKVAIEDAHRHLIRHSNPRYD